MGKRKRNVQSSQTAKSLHNQNKKIKHVETIPIIRAGLPQNMTLFNINSEVLLLMLSFLDWSDINVLYNSYECHLDDQNQLTSLLIVKMNRDFAGGIATLIKKTKKKLNSYSNDDLSWLLSQMDDSDMMAQSNANSVYSVPVSKLQTLAYEQVANPHYRRAAPMKLYNRIDVIRLCFERHGNVQLLKTYQSKLADRPSKRIETRSEILSKALAKCGLQVRSDSALCSQFISAKLALSKLDWIVEKMAQMKFCHEYSEEFKKNLEEIQQQKNSDFEYLEANWHDSDAHHEYHRDWDGVSLVDIASQGIVYPKIWPWLNNT